MTSEDENHGEDAKGHAVGTKDAGQHAIKVKQEMLNCMKARMTKDQVFRHLRESGVHPAIYFAVHRELRSQNKDQVKAYDLVSSVNRQIGRLNRQLADYRELQRRRNAAAADHQAGCNGANPSFSGDEPAEAPQAEATLSGLPVPPGAVAASAVAQHAYHQPALATTEEMQNFGAVTCSSRDIVPASQWQAAQHAQGLYLNHQQSMYHEKQQRASASAGDYQGFNGFNPSSSGDEPAATSHGDVAPPAMPAVPLSVSAPTTAQHAGHCLATVPAIPNFDFGALPGSSRGAVRRSADGLVPAAQWQAAQNGFNPDQHAPPNGWADGFGGDMASSYPPPARSGQLGTGQRFATPQGGAQHQRLPPQQLLQHGGGSVDGWFWALDPSTPSHVEKRPLTPSRTDSLLGLSCGEQQPGNQGDGSNGVGQVQTNQQVAGDRRGVTEEWFTEKT